MANINQLPYFQLNPVRDSSLNGVNNIKETNIIARFLLKKVKKTLKEKHPYHYLIFARQDKKLKYIQQLSKKYKYFLKLDIEKYYPSVNHKILLNILEKEVFKNNLSRRLKHTIKKELPLFLKQAPINNYGLPLGNYISWVLTGLYLLPLDFKIPRPFLRIQDDYLIFCKNKKEPERILKEIIEPELEKLELKININKLNSGKFHQNPVEFMGFRYYTGIFTICKNKIEEFKKRIAKITHLTKNKPEKAVIKSLNNQILGFGHYYKFANCKRTLEELDAFIRMRLRRYLNRTKDSKNRQGNLLLTNKVLQSLGLKSLLEICQKYTSKKRHIFQKKTKNRLKKSAWKRNFNWQELEEKGYYYRQKAILVQLEEISKNLKKIKNKVNKIEKKLNEQNSLNSQYF